MQVKQKHSRHYQADVLTLARARRKVGVCMWGGVGVLMYPQVVLISRAPVMSLMGTS